MTQTRIRDTEQEQEKKQEQATGVDAEFIAAIETKARILFEQGCTNNALPIYKESYTLKELALILNLTEGSLQNYVSWGWITSIRKKQFNATSGHTLSIHYVTPQAAWAYIPFVKHFRDDFLNMAISMGKTQKDFESYIESQNLPKIATIKEQQKKRKEGATIMVSTTPKQEQKQEQAAKPVQVVQKVSSYTTSHGLPPAPTLYNDVPALVSVPSSPIMSDDEECMLAQWQEEDSGSTGTEVPVSPLPTIPAATLSSSSSLSPTSATTRGQRLLKIQQNRQFIQEAHDRIYTLLESMQKVGEPVAYRRIDPKNMRVWDFDVMMEKPSSGEVEGETWRLLHDGQQATMLSDSYQRNIEQRLTDAEREVRRLEMELSYYKTNILAEKLPGYTDEMCVTLQRFPNATGYRIWSQKFHVGAEGKTREQAETNFRRVLAGFCTHLEQHQTHLNQQDAELLLELQYNLNRLK